MLCLFCLFLIIFSLIIFDLTPDMHFARWQVDPSCAPTDTSFACSSSDNEAFDPAHEPAHEVHLDGDSEFNSSSDDDTSNDHYQPASVVQQDGDSDCILSSDEDGDEDIMDPYLRTPLSDSTSTTVGDTLLMCLALGLRHSLSWAAIVDILTMINHLLEREVLKATKYFFLKYMEAGRGKTTFHLYCPYCERYLGSKEDLDGEVVVCQCGTQIKNLNQVKTYFLSLNLREQIKDFFKDSKFVRGLSYRFNRRKLNEDAYEDIYDGELYRSLSGPGKVLGGKFNLSYCFNTDGFPVGGRSGKQSCWPIYLQFNELPPHMRSKYMLMAGIYVGPKDPNMKIFMHPFVEEANILSSVGVDWSLNGRLINSKVIPLCACVDSPARAKLLNMKQFNGYFGCTLCYCQAESMDHGLRYTIPFTGLKERTHDEIVSDALAATTNIRRIRNKKKRCVHGIKGLTPVHTLNYMDLNRGVRPDTMHSKLIGNGNHITSILHESAGKEYYIGSDVKMNIITERLLSIKPPSSIMRPPRSMYRLCLWKATEWRAWILFYAVVCLQGLIPDQYVIHLSMLSSCLHIILQKSITADNLQRAHILVLRYVFLFQQFFGKKQMVYNIHLLLHTKRDIECLGPAWTNTAFGFEGANKGLLQLKKGCSSIAKEIARKYLTFRAFPFLSEKYSSSGNALKFCEKLSGRTLKSFYRVGDVVLVGKGHPCVLSPEEFRSLTDARYSSIREMLSFQKIVYNGVRLCTANYSSSHKHDDSYISIRGETRGRIQKICKAVTDMNTESLVIFVRELVLNEDPLFDDEYGKYCPIRKIDTEGRLLIIRPQDISTQCVAMFLDNGSFICDMPYGCYSES